MQEHVSVGGKGSNDRLKQIVLLLHNYCLPERIVQWVPLILELGLDPHHSSWHIKDASKNAERSKISTDITMSRWTPRIRIPAPD